MTNELIINGKDMDTIGVSMGDGFVSTLTDFPPMKGMVENKSPLQNGKRLAIKKGWVPKVDENNYNLIFTISGNSKDEYMNNKQALKEMFISGELVLQMPKVNSEYYHLWYRKSQSFAENKGRTFGKISASFNEPNPSARDKDLPDDSTVESSVTT